MDTGDAAAAFKQVRSILETPILDEHKWEKVPDIPSDGVIVDLEDSVPPGRKTEARAKAVEYLGRPDYFRGRAICARSNSLGTEWGVEDLQALAEAGTEVIVYPKLQSVAELREVSEILRKARTGAALFVVVESAAAVVGLQSIIETGLVRGLMFGPADLALDAGFAHFVDGKPFEDPYYYARSKLVLVAAANRLPVFDIVFVSEFRNSAEVREVALRSRHLGFTGMVSFYPPHIPIINEAFSPSSKELEGARTIVKAYEAARASGAPAVLSDRGQAILVQDYERSLRVLESART